MSDSNWREKFDFGVVLAVCALLIILPIAGLMLSEYAKVHRTNAAYQQNAEKDRKTASEEISKACFKPDPVTFSTCITEKLATYYKQQATNQDLQAQQDMAYWAKTLFFLGIFQLVFSATGIYFIWHTLDLNRSTLKLAIENNEIARDTYVNEHRPLLKVSPIEVGPITFDGNRIRVRTVLEAENCGSHTAINVQMNCQSYVSNTNMIVGESGLKSLLEMTQAFANIGVSGSILLRGEKSTASFTADAILDVPTEQRAARHQIKFSPSGDVYLSIAYCVYYRGMTAQIWRYVGHVAYVSVKGNLPINPANGDITPADIKLMILSDASKMN